MNATWQELLAESSLKPLTHEAVELFVCPLTAHGVISLTGEQSESYLQGQLTNDVLALREQSYINTAHCDAKGKMWSISQLVKQDESYYLIAGIQEYQASLKELQKYGVFAKTDIIDASEQLLIIAVGGANAKVLVDSLDATAIALTGSLTGNYLVLANKEQAASILADNQDNLYQASQWTKTTILAGVASLDEHSINQYVPQMLNLQALDAISFTKGCYTGQEMVARMKYLGKNKRATYIIKGTASQLPQNGDELQLAVGENWRRGGQLINVAGDEQGFYALAVMANDLESDSQLRIKDDENSKVAIEPLPYTISSESE